MTEYYYSARDILDKAIGTDAYFQIKSILTGMKADDVEPVRHGRWVWLGPCKDTHCMQWGTCLACGVTQRIGDFAAYCPFCGAKMDKEEL